MSDRMRDRVVARLAALGIGPSSIEAKRRLVEQKLSPVYLNDFIIGKKAQLRVTNLEAVARALECTVDYLTGQSEIWHNGAVLDGVCEVGAWRKRQAQIQHSVGVDPHPDFPWNRQAVFLVTGDKFKKFDIDDGSLVIAITNVEPRLGDKVVARFVRADGASETTIMLCKESRSYLKITSDQIETVSDGFDLVGKIVKSYAAF